MIRACMVSTHPSKPKAFVFYLSCDISSQVQYRIEHADIPRYWTVRSGQSNLSTVRYMCE